MDGCKTHLSTEQTSVTDYREMRSRRVGPCIYISFQYADEHLDRARTGFSCIGCSHRELLADSKAVFDFTRAVNRMHCCLS